MKLTIFSQHFWPENFRINDLADKLKSIGFKVNVFTAKPNYPVGIIPAKYKSFLPIKDNFRGIDIIRFPIVQRGNANFISLTMNYISFIVSSTIFSFFYKKKFGNFFFVYATSPILQAIPVVILRKLFNIKLVLWVQDLWPYNLSDTGYIKNSFFLKIIDCLVNKIYDSSDLILCQSEAFSKVIKKKTNSKIKILHNPSNYNFNFRPKQKKFFFDIYYTGNLGRGQNFGNILKAFASKQVSNLNIRLIIFGSGKNFHEMKKEIKKMNSKNIILQKAVSPERLKKIMFHADCFILKLNNGIGLSKTIPAKFQTYLSFGKPIISINNGAVTQIIKKYKIGLYSRTEKTKDLINILLKSKKLSNNQLNKIAKNCEKLFMKKFEINNTCKKLKKYLEELR